MEKEEFKIEIESSGDYSNRKEFNTRIKLTSREYLSLVALILDFVDTLEKEKQVEEITTN